MASGSRDATFYYSPPIELMQRLFLASTACNVTKELLEFLGKPPAGLNVAFIPTAADPYSDKEFVEQDKRALLMAGFNVKEVHLGKTRASVIEGLEGTDIVFVAGGNTFYLMQKARESGFDRVVKSLVRKGTVYVGSSAGAVIAGPSIEHVRALDDASWAPRLQSFEGLGLVKFLVMPHHGKRQYRQAFLKIDKDCSKSLTVKLTDSQAVEVVGKKYRVVGRQ